MTDNYPTREEEDFVIAQATLSGRVTFRYTRDKSVPWTALIGGEVIGGDQYLNFLRKSRAASYALVVLGVRTNEEHTKFLNRWGDNCPKQVNDEG